MGLRFNRSVRLFPGVRLNLGTGGASLTVGAPGASVNIGPRGTYGNVGLPGSGLSYRQRLDTPKRTSTAQIEHIPCSIALHGDDIVLVADDGRDIAPGDADRIMRENAAAVRQVIDAEVERRNSTIESDIRPVRTATPSADTKPERMVGETQPDYLGRVGRWRAQAANNMEQRLLSVLESIDWGRETNISCQIAGDRVLLDIDLPEIEDIPDHLWRPAARGQSPGVVRGTVAAGELNRRYVRIVSAIARVAIGAVIERMPSVGGVGASAYTTRSGHDDYVIVADVTRDAWIRGASETDDEIALSRMGASLAMTSTGRLKAQRPITS